MIQADGEHISEYAMPTGTASCRPVSHLAMQVGRACMRALISLAKRTSGVTPAFWGSANREGKAGEEEGASEAADESFSATVNQRPSNFMQRNIGRCER
jgi:hypothetical protein